MLFGDMLCSTLHCTARCGLFWFLIIALFLTSIILDVKVKKKHIILTSLGTLWVVEHCYN